MKVANIMQKEEGLGVCTSGRVRAARAASEPGPLLLSDLESGFSGRLEETEGEDGGPHACTVLVAPVANAFPSTHTCTRARIRKRTHARAYTRTPLVTQSHVKRGKENCYYRVPLYLNQRHAFFN